MEFRATRWIKPDSLDWRRRLPHRRERNHPFAVTDLQNVERRPSPTVTPQALAWSKGELWLGSRDLKQVYRLDPASWKVLEQIEPPGIPWAAVAGNDEIFFTIGEGENDDRYIYRY